MRIDCPLATEQSLFMVTFHVLPEPVAWRPKRKQRFHRRMSALQVAEGVSTAAAVVGLGRKHRVSLPVLTAVAQVLDGNLSPKEVVFEIMNLPQIDEK